MQKPCNLSALTGSSLAAEQQALRALLASLDQQPEMLLERTLRDPKTQHNIGRFIGHAIAKLY